jgi:hypothetical protein
MISNLEGLMATTGRAGCAAGLLIALFMGAGCGGESATGEVSGTVTVDGKVPPPGSSITFFPMDGKTASAGGLLEDGKYTVRVPVGMAKIEIRVPRPVIPRPVRKSKEVKEGPGAEGEVVEESLPAKYNDQSELRLDVQPGKNPKDYDLKSK